MPKHIPPVRLCDHVIAMVGGIETGYLDDKYYSKDTAPTIPIRRTQVPPVATNIIQSLLTQPGAANILLYGIPGTGKTEFARSIVAASGQTAYQVRHAEDTDSRFPENRRISLMAAANSVALLTDLVAKHAKAIGVQSGSRMQPIPAAYDASILNTDVSLDRVVSSVTKASESAPANGWGAEYGLNLLLWGAPGTGKTAFAQHIAETTGRELLVKRASDILSPFVGMTERYIAEAFEEASETGSILLIDEADSLLIDRRYARQSWETTQTNELLCQMESFPGMLICCTNLLDKLDPAVLRRFSWKVEFRELSPSARQKICARYFPGITGWDNAEDLSSLRGLTPGDVKAVWQRSRTVGESYTTALDVIAALAEELRYKAPKADGIGFKS
jgi:SpoVK/Ycf46/Vps4 family AAA+-type ATPase